jgi:hypothetical protein
MQLPHGELILKNITGLENLLSTKYNKDVGSEVPTALVMSILSSGI